MEDKDSLHRVSIIIPTKNEEDVLEDCLESIISQSVQPLETIIVDGGSTDKTLEISKRFHARVVIEERSSSPANARNLGVEKAGGDILLVLDADTLLARNCLEQATKAFDDKNVIAVLPSQLEEDHSYLELIQRKWTDGSRTSMSVGVRKAKTSGFVMFFRKEVFVKTKFDTKYGFGEDDDFSVRLEKTFDAGRIVVSSDCKVISHSPHTLKELATRYMWWGRTFPTYFAKHINFRSTINAVSLLFPALLTIGLGFSIFFPQIRLVFIILSSLFGARILTVCFRSKSTLFFQFALFDIARSFLFVAGLARSPFLRKRGR